MLGLIILGGLVLYIMIAIKMTSYVMNKTNRTKYAVITALLFFLIPTWDLILGYPIYWYLCKHEAGIKIYKTVDNVEGFYVAESYDFSPVEPYRGYRFIDYKDDKNGKYYRNSWLDSNTSSECVSYIGAQNYNYTQAFQSGKCIAKQELKENEVSQFEVTDKRIYSDVVSVLGLKKVISMRIIDKQNQKEIARLTDYIFGEGWVISLLSTSTMGNRSWESCLGYDFSFEHKLLKNTLIPVGGK